MARTHKSITAPQAAKPAVERIPHPMRTADFDRWLEDFPGRRWLQSFPFQRAFPAMPAMPSVDIIDRGDEVVVKAEVPGYRKEDIEVTVSGTFLTLKGETGAEKKEEKKGEYFRCEISHGSFSRTLALPAAVDDRKANAVMKDGVLELTLPKLEKAKRRTIAIS